MSLLDHGSVLDPASAEDRDVPRNLEIDPDHLPDFFLRPFRVFVKTPVVVPDSVERQVVAPRLGKLPTKIGTQMFIYLTEPKFFCSSRLSCFKNKNFS